MYKNYVNNCFCFKKFKLFQLAYLSLLHINKMHVYKKKCLKAWLNIYTCIPYLKEGFFSSNPITDYLHFTTLYNRHTIPVPSIRRTRLACSHTRYDHCGTHVLLYPCWRGCYKARLDCGSGQYIIILKLGIWYVTVTFHRHNMGFRRQIIQVFNLMSMQYIYMYQQNKNTTCIIFMTFLGHSWQFILY